MSSLFDDQILEFKCPKCGKNIKKTVAWFKAENCGCPFCGNPIDNKEFRRGLSDVDKTIEEFGRKLSNTKIDMKINL